MFVIYRFEFRLPEVEGEVNYLVCGLSKGFV
jgi:hypothetical protein